MVNTSPRELLEVPSTWSIPRIQEALHSALQGAGPALAFAPSRFTSVHAEVAVVIPTSGSTGNPKEVALTATAIRASAAASHQFLGAVPGQCWSLLLPTSHIAGVNVLVRAIELGTQIAEKNFDYTSIVPTQLFRALNEEGDLLHSLQNAQAVLVGGAAIDPELLRRAKESGIGVVTTYGMSEMSGGCIYNGQLLDGVEVEIRAEDRIALRGPMQAREYLGSSAPLADSDGWFMTNDAGYFENGTVTILGRIDDLIISGGEKISLSAIDSFLNKAHQNTFMSCAIPHQEWGQQLCLAASGAFDRDEISQSLRENFGNHAVPKLFLQNIQLPLTAIGKPDRLALSKKFEMIRP